MAEGAADEVDDWIAFDCETTGLEPGCRLLELAAVRFRPDGSVVDEFSTIIDPGIPVLPDIVALVGLSPGELAAGASTRAALGAFRDWLPERGRLVAHNARFDVNVLGWECERVRRAKPKLPVVDSLALAKALPTAPSGRLQDLVEHYGWERRGRAHRALPDADATRRLVLEARRVLPPGRFAALTVGVPFANSWHYPRRWEADHAALPQAQRRGKAILIRYTDARGAGSERWVTPHGFAVTAQGCRFHGWCHLRGERRLFALERTEILAGPDVPAAD